MTYPNNNEGQYNQGYGQQGYPQGYGQQGYGEGYGQEQYNQGYYEAQPSQEGLIAGRFQTKKVVSNLVLLALLGAVVTFAVVFLVDLLVAQIAGYSAGGVSSAVLAAVVAGLIGIGAGLLYIPVSGTGNEHLFGIAVIALAVVAAVLWVILGGLLDGDWATLVTLAGIVCTATIAYGTPSRIESAAVY